MTTKQQTLEDALRCAVEHVEHMAAWISAHNAGYSFECLGEDMPGLKAPLALPDDAASIPADLEAWARKILAEEYKERGAPEEYLDMLANKWMEIDSELPPELSVALSAMRRIAAAQRAEIERLRSMFECSPGALEIAKERARQIEVEGWSAEHDDREHSEGQLIMAAIWFAAPDWLRRFFEANDINIWPWDEDWRKSKGQRRDLERAGALIAAEIDRLVRAVLTEQEKT